MHVNDMNNIISPGEERSEAKVGGASDVTSCTKKKKKKKRGWSSCCGSGERNPTSIHEDAGSIPGLAH